MKTVKNDILKGRALSLRVASLSAVLFVICLFPLQAQDSDFVTWNKMKARYDVAPKVELYGDVEMRTRDALEEIDRWGFGVGTSVRLLSFLKAEGGYEFHYRNRGENGWKSRHRYHAGVSFTLKKRQWTFTLRERFQHTFDGRGADEFRLRTRLKAAYKSSAWSADVFYCYQHESDLDRHVLGWELIYRF